MLPNRASKPSQRQGNDWRAQELAHAGEYSDPVPLLRRNFIIGTDIGIGTRVVKVFTKLQPVICTTWKIIKPHGKATIAVPIVRNEIHDANAKLNQGGANANDAARLVEVEKRMKHCEITERGRIEDFRNRHP